MLKRPDASLDQRVRDALDIIRPAAGRRDACIEEIKAVIDAVDSHRGTYKTTLGQYRKEYLALDKAMVALEAASDVFCYPAGWPSREQIRAERAELAELFGDVEPQRSGKQREGARTIAVWQARRLLRDYSNRKPTKYRDGAWLKLATVLYDRDNADLFQDMLDADEPEIIIERVSVENLLLGCQ
jgi:hypothetical protein